jgi:hypothetical protein
MGPSGSYERFSCFYALQVQKVVKRPNFISFYTISSLSLAKKWVSHHNPFTKNFPKIPTLPPPLKYLAP